MMVGGFGLFRICANLSRRKTLKYLFASSILAYLAHKNKSPQTPESFGIDLISCPTGSLIMGSQTDGYDEETPIHEVQITKAFQISQTLITQEQWFEVMGTNPSFYISKHHPVENISWYEALLFCNQLSLICCKTPCYEFLEIQEVNQKIRSAHILWHRNHDGYRLLTESEWEYAARSNQNFLYAGSSYIDEVAWFDGNSANQTHDVKLKKPNAWGLYDMSGNVAEWCIDQYENRYTPAILAQQTADQRFNPVYYTAKPYKRVTRGGAYWDNAAGCRITVRSWYDPYQTGDCGLRIACDLNEKQLSMP